MKSFSSKLLSFLLILSFFSSFQVKGQSETTIIVTTAETGYYNQKWNYSGVGNPLDEADIKKNWNEDMYITSAAFTSHGWFFAMSKGVKWTGQFYKISSSWPDAYVHDQKAKGNMITTLAASDNQWFVVTSANTGITDQQICSAPWSHMKTWIKEWWDKKYYITGVACQNGLWTVLMSNNTNYTEQAYMWGNTADEIATKIKEYWDKGYRITACEYGGKQFLCVMSKYPNSATVMQSRFIKKSENPTSFIKESWDAEPKRNITYIGG